MTKFMLLVALMILRATVVAQDAAGTITLSSQTIQQVYFEAAQSLMKHGFRRFLLLNSHGGNQIITRYIADRINQETEGIAVELGDAAAPRHPSAHSLRAGGPAAAPAREV